MKKQMSVLLSLFLLFSFAACGRQSSENEPSMPVSESEKDADVSESREPAEEPATDPENTENDSSVPVKETDDPSGSSGNMLVVYFSVPEDVSTDGVDAVAGASIVVNEDEVLGNTQYVASLIAEHTGADLFRIEPETPYPADHDPLVDYAAEEQDSQARPAIANHIDDPDAYDTIFIGYPNWWGDMPQILYAFLDEYDLSGKKIVPFCTHGGSGFSQTIGSIAELEPNAVVTQDGYVVSRDNVLEADIDVPVWLESLGY